MINKYVVTKFYKSLLSFYILFIIHIIQQFSKIFINLIIKKIRYPNFVQNKRRHIIINRCILQMLKNDSTNVQYSTIGNACNIII